MDYREGVVYIRSSLFKIGRYKLDYWVSCSRQLRRNWLPPSAIPIFSGNQADKNANGCGLVGGKNGYPPTQNSAEPLFGFFPIKVLAFKFESKIGLFAVLSAAT